jgi:Ner family transcriptional regulator
MKKYDIKARIEEKGSSLSAVAKSAGLHNSSCRQALRYPVPAANAAIAEFLGKKLHELWPLWFDQEGNRLASGSSFRISSRKKSSPKRGRG